MTYTQSIELFFMIAPIIIGYFLIVPIYRRAKRNRNRYRFFEFRDNLILLVAEGHLKETDPIFIKLYTQVNKVINNTHRFNLKNLIGAVSSDLANDEKVKVFINEIQQYKPEVQEVVSQYFIAIGKSLHSNSLTFRIAIYIFQFSWFCNKWVTMAIKKIKPIILEAHHINKNSNTIIGAT